MTDPSTGLIRTFEYSSISNNQIQSNHVNFVFEDKQKNIWLGTQKGLYSVNPANNQIKSYFPGKEEDTESSFLAVHQTADRIWFGDHRGILWSFSGRTNKFEKIQLAASTRITDIASVGNSHLIVTTAHAGFFVYSVKNRAFSELKKNNSAALLTNNFISVTVDSYGIAWLETDQPGVCRYRLSDNSVKHFRPKTDAVSRISVLPNFIVYEDVKKRLWINPQGGGFSRYNRQTDMLEYFYNEPGDPTSRFSNIIHSVYSDNKGK